MTRMVGVPGYVDEDTGEWVEQTEREMTPEEEAAADEAQAEWDAGQEKREAQNQLESLQAEITNERLMNYMLNVDGGWLKSQYDKIAALKKLL